MLPAQPGICQIRNVSPQGDEVKAKINRSMTTGQAAEIPPATRDKGIVKADKEKSKAMPNTIVVHAVVPKLVIP